MKQPSPETLLQAPVTHKKRGGLFREAARMARFGLVGVAATITHASMALLALNVFAFPALLSNLFGFVCAFLVSLTGQTLFTFGAKMSTKIALKFSAVALLAFSISSAVVLLGQALTSLSGNAVVSAAAFSVPAITYVCNSLWTFRPDPSDRNGSECL